MRRRDKGAGNMAPLRIEGDKAEPRKRLSRGEARFYRESALDAAAFARRIALDRARRGFAPGSLRLLGVEDQPDGSNVVRFETVPSPPAGW